jgi:hypothetical protein
LFTPFFSYAYFFFPDRLRPLPIEPLAKFVPYSLSLEKSTVGAPTEIGADTPTRPENDNDERAKRGGSLDFQRIPQ